MPGKYLTPDDVPEEGSIKTVRAIEREVVDGRPRLVVYFDGEDCGLLLTRELAEDLTRILGPCPWVDEFFASEGALH